MELRHLRSFLTVAETLNFSRAAERLHLSQPALSRQVQELESDLDVPLFSREKGKVSLTDAGRALIEHARELLARSENAAAHVQAVSRGECATIEVGYAPSLAVQLLPLVLERLAQSHPSMNLRMHDMSSDEMNAGLKSGALHLAYTVGAGVLAEAGLVKETLVSYPVCVAMSRTHPWARRKQIALSDLATAPLLGYARNAYPEYPRWIESVLASARIKPRMAAEFDSVSSMLLRLEAGTGVSLVPWSFSCHGVERITLRPVTPDPPPLDLVMCWKRGHDSAALRAVREVSTACALDLRKRKFVTP
jgi:DNA-binding transcriptional LysR family regulator